jgi:Tfp pilus assembly protein PilN
MALEILALAIVLAGLLAGVWIVARLSQQIEALTREVRDLNASYRAEIRRLDERADLLHEKMGRLEIFVGGKGRHS